MLLKGKNILIGVTGSIAAYKTPNLVSALVKLGANVDVLMTENAKEFITPLVFETLTKNRCQTDTFNRDFSFEVEHISLAKKADIVMVAPATANIIAKLAHGIADDMLSSTLLACGAKKLIVPAMNTNMYEAQVTQDNLSRLKELGYEIITPDKGLLACGDTGNGKMPEPEILLEHILLRIGREKILEGKNVLVTAGPTREAIDPVRFISNHSTGKMGYALARQAVMAGAKVTLVSGTRELKNPLGVDVIHVDSAAQMFDAVVSKFDDTDIVLKAAAVADYRPKTVATEKIKKKDTSDSVIELERTLDILKYLGEHKKHQILCGFSMETEKLLENSTAKLDKKNLDLIIGNNLKVKGAGFATDTNIVTLITKEGYEELEMMTKDEVSFLILKRICDMMQTR